MGDIHEPSVPENLKWLEHNAVNPFLNSLAIEPLKAGAELGNGISRACSGKDFLPEIVLLEVDQAEFGSAACWTQNICSGLAMAVPYAGAGRIAGGALRVAASAIKLERTAARLGAGKNVLNLALRVEQAAVHKSTAQVMGAVAYDGLKEVHQGQSREGNMARSAFQFGTYEAGNALLSTLPGSDLMVSRNPLARVSEARSIQNNAPQVQGAACRHCQLCPDMEGKWWQVGKNAKGEWKLLDYGAALPRFCKPE